MFENGHMALCYVRLNKYASKYAGENIVRLHADKKSRDNRNYTHITTN